MKAHEHIEDTNTAQQNRAVTPLQAEGKVPCSLRYLVSCITKVLADPASFEQPTDADNRKALQNASAELTKYTAKLSLLHFQAFDHHSTNHHSPPDRMKDCSFQSQVSAGPSKQPEMAQTKASKHGLGSSLRGESKDSQHRHPHTTSEAVLQSPEDHRPSPGLSWKADMAQNKGISLGVQSKDSQRHTNSFVPCDKLFNFIDTTYRDIADRLHYIVSNSESSPLIAFQTTSQGSAGVKSTTEFISDLARASHEDLLAHCLELHYVLQECLGLKKKLKPTLSPGTNHLSGHSSQSVDIALPQPSDTLVECGTDIFAKEVEEVAFDSDPLSGSTSPHAELHREVSDSNIITARLTEHFRKGEDPDGMKVINDKYVVLQELGRGSCAKVKLAYDQEAKKLVAMKIVRRPPTIAKASNDHLEQGADIRGEARPVNMKFQAMACEIAVMKKLRHNNIVSLLEVIDDPSAQKMYLIMKYIDKGPIGKVDTTALTCTKIDPVELIGYARQMAAGLHYLHDRGIIHRDLKPENILIDSDKQVYLADFGVSETLELNEEDRTGKSAAKLHSSVMSNVSESYVFADQNIEKTKQDVESRRGTLLFLPPEILAHGIGDGFSVDMWSLGITLFALLVGELPFKREEEILKAKLSYPEYIGPQWRQVLRHLLARNPKKRLTIGELRRFLYLMEKGQGIFVEPPTPLYGLMGKTGQQAKSASSVWSKDQSLRENSATFLDMGLSSNIKSIITPKPPVHGTPSPHRSKSSPSDGSVRTTVGSNERRLADDSALVGPPPTSSVRRFHRDAPPEKPLPSDEGSEADEESTTPPAQPMVMPISTLNVGGPPQQRDKHTAEPLQVIRSNVGRMVEQASRARSNNNNSSCPTEFSDDEELNRMDDPPPEGLVSSLRASGRSENTHDKSSELSSLLVKSPLQNSIVAQLYKSNAAPFVVFDSKSNGLKSVARLMFEDSTTTQFATSTVDGTQQGEQEHTKSSISTTGRMAPITQADVSSAITLCTSTQGGSFRGQRGRGQSEEHHLLLGLNSHDGEHESVIASQTGSRTSNLSFGALQPPQLPAFSVLGYSCADQSARGPVQKSTTLFQPSATLGPKAPPVPKNDNANRIPVPEDRKKQVAIGEAACPTRGSLEFRLPEQRSHGGEVKGVTVTDTGPGCSISPDDTKPKTVPPTPQHGLPLNMQHSFTGSTQGLGSATH